MELSIEAIIFYFVLIDSIFANIATWCSPKLMRWYTKHWKRFSKEFPLAKGWTIYYFVLVVWIGYGLNRLSII
jgi:hypothetical protein